MGLTRPAPGHMLWLWAALRPLAGVLHIACPAANGDEKRRTRNDIGMGDEMRLLDWAGLTATAAAAVLLCCATDPAAAFKDVGPKGTCDGHEKGGAAWTQCVSAARADAELFYAGYWLARTGRYEEALSYLRQAKQADARVLTYIGFATRKLGRTDEAMGYYRDALDLDPGYSVARAYMGEGFLAKGERQSAADQLAEIARRSGTASAEYGDLAQHIARYDAEHVRVKG